ncbi:MAG TPA: DUF5996 family protein [Pyrinomonadaceae bacterium]|nr:DUF5996 family protein [Pyrinomonadaceae bacterium]
MTDSRSPAAPAVEAWPALPFGECRETYETLHMLTQIVGKVRLVQTPWINHSWHVPLYLTSRGLTTSAIPHGARSFQIDFDFIDHRLLTQVSTGESREMALAPRPVAEVYRELFEGLAALGLDVKINTTPNEVANAVPFERDFEHASYEPEQANRFWRALSQAARVFTQFRARFSGKCSPVHFFWGSFDLAVTRFSGRRAPEHPGGVPNLPDWVAREAYSHEVSSCGFWPGSEQVPEAVFYSYAYPEPEGFKSAKVGPAGATYHTELREFVLPYETVRQAASPDSALLEFLQSTYEAAADLGHWDRPALEMPPRS